MPISRSSLPPIPPLRLGAPPPPQCQRLCSARDLPGYVKDDSFSIDPPRPKTARNDPLLSSDRSSIRRHPTRASGGQSAHESRSEYIPQSSHRTGSRQDPAVVARQLFGNAEAQGIFTRRMEKADDLVDPAVSRKWISQLTSRKIRRPTQNPAINSETDSLYSQSQTDSTPRERTKVLNSEVERESAASSGKSKQQARHSRFKSEFSRVPASGGSTFRGSRAPEIPPLSSPPLPPQMRSQLDTPKSTSRSSTGLIMKAPLAPLSITSMDEPEPLPPNESGSKPDSDSLPPKIKTKVNSQARTSSRRSPSNGVSRELTVSPAKASVLKAESKSECKPQPKSESKPLPKSESKPQSKSDSKPQAKALLKSEPKSLPKVDPKAEAKKETKSRRSSRSTTRSVFKFPTADSPCIEDVPIFTESPTETYSETYMDRRRILKDQSTSMRSIQSGEVTGQKSDGWWIKRKAEQSEGSLSRKVIDSGGSSFEPVAVPTPTKVLATCVSSDRQDDVNNNAAPEVPSSPVLRVQAPSGQVVLIQESLGDKPQEPTIQIQMPAIPEAPIEVSRPQSVEPDESTGRLETSGESAQDGFSKPAGNVTDEVVEDLKKQIEGLQVLLKETQANLALSETRRTALLLEQCEDKTGFVPSQFRTASFMKQSSIYPMPTSISIEQNRHKRSLQTFKNCAVVEVKGPDTKAVRYDPGGRVRPNEPPELPIVASDGKRLQRRLSDIMSRMATPTTLHSITEDKPTTTSAKHKPHTTHHHPIQPSSSPLVRSAIRKWYEGQLEGGSPVSRRIFHSHRGFAILKMKDRSAMVDNGFYDPSGRPLAILQPIPWLGRDKQPVSTRKRRNSTVERIRPLIPASGSKKFGDPASHAGSDDEFEWVKVKKRKEGETETKADPAPSEKTDSVNNALDNKLVPSAAKNGEDNKEAGSQEKTTKINGKDVAVEEKKPASDDEFEYVKVKKQVKTPPPEPVASPPVKAPAANPLSSLFGGGGGRFPGGGDGPGGGKFGGFKRTGLGDVGSPIPDKYVPKPHAALKAKKLLWQTYPPAKLAGSIWDGLLELESTWMTASQVRAKNKAALVAQKKQTMRLTASTDDNYDESIIPKLNLTKINSIGDFPLSSSSRTGPATTATTADSMTSTSADSRYMKPPSATHRRFSIGVPSTFSDFADRSRSSTISPTYYWEDDFDVPYETSRFEVNFEKFTELFFEDEESLAAKKAQMGLQNVVRDKKARGILDPKRLQNLEISLKALGLYEKSDYLIQTVTALDLGLPETDKYILECDRLPVDKRFTASQLEIVLGLIPTEDEISTLKSAADDELRKSESILLQWISVPRFKKRVEACIAILTYKESAQSIENKITKLVECINDLKHLSEAQVLKSVFGLSLRIGNFVNYNNNKGRAPGFLLGSFEQFKKLPTVDNKSSLLRVIADVLDVQYPSVWAELAKLDACNECCQINPTEIESLLRSLERTVRDVRKEVTDAGNIHDDRFLEVMSRFIDNSSDSLESLDNRNKKALKALQHVTTLFTPTATSAADYLEVLKQLGQCWKLLQDSRKQNHEDYMKNRLEQLRTARLNLGTKAIHQLSSPTARHSPLSGSGVLYEQIPNSSPGLLLSIPPSDEERSAIANNSAEADRMLALPPTADPLLSSAPLITLQPPSAAQGNPLMAAIRAKKGPEDTSAPAVSLMSAIRARSAPVDITANDDPPSPANSMAAIRAKKAPEESSVPENPLMAAIRAKKAPVESSVPENPLMAAIRARKAPEETATAEEPPSPANALMAAIRAKKNPPAEEPPLTENPLMAAIRTRKAPQETATTEEPPVPDNPLMTAIRVRKAPEESSIPENPLMAAIRARNGSAKT